MSENIHRKLTAIFSADVAGYSRLMRDDEMATISLLSEYRQIMSALILQHKGRVVDSTGDNILADFSSVVDAVQSAVAIQRELEARNARLPEARMMKFRIGINIGDVIQEDDRIYGDGVNIAARLESMAEPGGICISRSAYDQIESKLPLGYAYLGEQAAKNINKPLYAYRVILHPEDEARNRGGEESARAGVHPIHRADEAVHGRPEHAHVPPLSVQSGVRNIALEGAIRPPRGQPTGGPPPIPAESGDAVPGLSTEVNPRGKNLQFILVLGVILLAINMMSSFGDWWFQFPLLVAGLIIYIRWVKRSLPTSKKMVAMREKILVEESAHAPQGTGAAGRETGQAGRRVNLAMAYYRNFYLYIGIGTFLLLINLLTNPYEWWFQYPLVIWGVLLFLHRMKVKKHLPQ